MFVFLPMAAAAAGAGAAAPVGAAVAGAGGIGGGLAAAAGGLGGFFQNLLVNIGLALLSSLFATKPSEENTRQNDMFGSLTNTTSSGVPVALNYGMVRVAGQMVSGYVLSMGHSKTQQMNIYGEVMASTSTSAAEQQVARSQFLSGFNSF
jgi:predicted phage tail protein